MSNAALAFDPGRCTSVAKCGAKASTLHRAFWVRVKFPSKGYAAIATECRVTLSGKQLGRVLTPAIEEYEAWLQGKVVESAARAAVQLSPASQRKAHTEAMKEGSAELAKRWGAVQNEQEEAAAAARKTPSKSGGGGTRSRKTPSKPAGAVVAAAAAPKKVKAGAATTHACGTRLPNGQGAASIISALKAKFPGWRGCTAKAMIDKAKKTPGLSPSRKRRLANRNLTDDEEAAFFELAGEADDSNSQLSRAQLQEEIQKGIVGTTAEDSFKNGVVSLGFVDKMLDRAEKRGVLGTAVPVDDSGPRLDWCTHDNFKNYFDDLHTLFLKMEVAVPNASYNEQVRLEVHVSLSYPLRFGFLSLPAKVYHIKRLTHNHPPRLRPSPPSPFFRSR